MPQTHTSHDLNVIGAFALATSDEMLAIGPAASTGVLVVLGQAREGRTINSIARALQVSHSRAVRIADELEDAGLARRVPSKEDRRVVRLTLTRKGANAAARAQQTRNRVLEAALGELSEREVTQLARLASKVLRSSTRGHDHAEAICRLCDAVGCGHFDGRCPVTAATAEIDAVAAGTS